MIEAEQIIGLMAAYVLPFARLAGFLMVVSVIGSRNFPPRFRLLLAMAMIVLVVPVLPKSEALDLFSLGASLLIIKQVLIGILLGFVSRLLLETFVIGAQIVAMQSGLGFASLVDPSNGASVPALSQFFLLLTTLLFLSFDGHLYMIRLVIESFHSLPVGQEQNFFEMFYQVVAWSKWIFATAFIMAIVAVASLLIVNIAFGVMTRAAPQINLFVVGFPLTLVVGLILIWVVLANFLPYFEQQLTRANLLICNLIALECQ
jgi:flagellar biosynthetic protein FliR